MTHNPMIEGEGDRRAWQHFLQTQMEILSREEVERLVLIACYTRAKTDPANPAVPETELEALLAWARETRTNSSMLEAALAGEIAIHMHDGKLSFSLSAKGIKEARQIVRTIGLPVSDESDQG